MKSIKFKAEIKKVQAKKTVSLDKEVELVLITDDITVLELGKVPTDKLVIVEVQEEN